VVEQNVGCLPAPFGSHCVERVERVVRRLLARRDVDVIVLVELYDEGARAHAVSRLKDAYPWIVSRAGGGSFLPEDSGILVASRLPIVERGRPRIAFRPFRTRGPMTRSDFWAAKGVLGVELRLDEERTLCLLATHLMADYEVVGQYEHVRRSQLAEVVTFAREFCRDVPGGCCTSTVLVGDLNVPAERVVPEGRGIATRLEPTAEYERMLELLLHPTDLYRASHPRGPGWTWNHDPFAPGADPVLPRMRLDYAFHLTGLAAHARPAHLSLADCALVTHEQGIADHRGLAFGLRTDAAPAPLPRSGPSTPDTPVGDAPATDALARLDD